MIKVELEFDTLADAFDKFLCGDGTCHGWINGFDMNEFCFRDMEDIERHTKSYPIWMVLIDLIKQHQADALTSKSDYVRAVARIILKEEQDEVQAK